MKFSIGDNVLLKETGEEGVVTGYLGSGMYEVAVSGVVFPVFEDSIEHPYLKWFTEQNKKRNKKVKQSVAEELPPPEKTGLRRSREAKGLFLSFLPVMQLVEMEEIVDELKVFLLNELPYPIRFKYEMKLGEELYFFHEGVLNEFSHLYLHKFPYVLVNDRPRIHWVAADADTSKGLRESTEMFRIRPAQIVKQIADMHQRGEAMFSMLLVDSFELATVAPIEKPTLQASSVPRSQRGRTNSLKDIPQYELDLHIENLDPNYKARKFSNAEILQIQLDQLRRNLALAIMHRMERMIVIHGLGRGILRDAVHQVLKETPEVSHFSNEWMGRYGFGATEVHFRY